MRKFFRIADLLSVDRCTVWVGANDSLNGMHLVFISGWAWSGKRGS